MLYVDIKNTIASDRLTPNKGNFSDKQSISNDDDDGSSGAKPKLREGNNY